MSTNYPHFVGFKPVSGFEKNNLLIPVMDFISNKKLGMLLLSANRFNRTIREKSKFRSIIQ